MKPPYESERYDLNHEIVSKITNPDGTIHLNPEAAEDMPYEWVTRLGLVASDPGGHIRHMRAVLETPVGEGYVPVLFHDYQKGDEVIWEHHGKWVKYDPLTPQIAIIVRRKTE